MIIFFGVSGKAKMPQTGNFKTADKGKAKTYQNNIENASGSINTPKNLNLLEKFVTAVATGNRQLKLSDVFLTLIDLARHNLLHDGRESLALIHRNGMEQLDKRKLYYINATIGSNHNAKIKKYLTGPVQEPAKKLLVSTQKDWLGTEMRNELTTHCGINERGYVFFNNETFLSYGDLSVLCDLEKYESEIRQTELNKNKIVKEVVEKLPEEINLGNLTSESIQHATKLGKQVVKSLKETGKRHEKVVRYYSTLLETTRKLKIINRILDFDTHIVIHLVSFRSPYSEINSIEKLIASVLPTGQTTYLEKLQIDELKDYRPAKNIDGKKFANHVVTSLNADIKSLESFQENCQIVKSWKRTLPERAILTLELREIFRDGIYLNKLYDSIDRKVDLEMPSHLFFMLEFFGDKRGQVKRNKDEIVLSGVYSLCKLDFEFDLEVKYLTTPEDTDKVFCFKRTSKDNEFESEDLKDLFYPTREDTFSVPFNNIDVSYLSTKGRKKQPEFTIDSTASFSSDEHTNFLTEILRKLGKFNPGEEENMTEDDLDFLDETLGKEDEK